MKNILLSLIVIMFTINTGLNAQIFSIRDNSKIKKSIFYQYQNEVAVSTTGLRNMIDEVAMTTGNFVNKSGDTMTGVLIISTITNVSRINWADGTISTSANNISTNNISTWALYPATTSVNMNGYSIYNSTYIATKGISIGNNADLTIGYVVSNTTVTTGMAQNTFRDENTISLNTQSGYASIDIQPTIKGNVGGYNHYVALQPRAIYNGISNIQRFAGLETIMVTNSTSAIIENYGIRIRDIGGTGPVTNNYGLRIDSIVRGTNNYAIHTQGGQVYFTGKVTIDDPYDDWPLNIHYGSMKTYGGSTTVARFMSNDASNKAGLQIYAWGGATQSDRKIQIQTIEEGIANDGMLGLQPDGGRVGIRRWPTSYELEVGGNAGKTVGGTAWVDLSDIRLKTIIGNIDDGLSKVMALRPVKYEWNELRSTKYGRDPGIKYGFVANELKDIIPEFVGVNTEGYYTYNPSGIEAILTSAIQELKNEIDALKNEIELLKSK